MKSETLVRVGWHEITHYSAYLTKSEFDKIAELAASSGLEIADVIASEGFGKDVDFELIGDSIEVVQ